MTSRRNFLQRAGLIGIGGFAPLQAVDTRMWERFHPGIDPMLHVEDPILHELAMRALDAARTAGATYADVRFTADRVQKVFGTERRGGIRSSDDGSVYVGVRALVDGYWGFASSCIGSGEAVTSLAQNAVAQAKVNNWGAGPAVTLDAHPPNAQGSWTTPVEQDPFAVTIEEKGDLLSALLATPERLGFPTIRVGCDLVFRRQRKLLATTSGAVLAQTLIWAGPSTLSVALVDRSGWSQRHVLVPLVPLQTAGYEVASALRIQDQFQRYVDILLRQDRPFAVPIGRYPVVFDALTSAAILSATLGRATEVDRILGEEVNATGTSYLSLASVGTPVTSSMVSVTGTRTLPRGASHAKWDDDGVETTTFPLVDRGVLTALSTGREHAALAATHETAEPEPERDVFGRSKGCATSDTAANLPLVRTPDLVMRPGGENMSFDDLVMDTKSGIAVLHGGCTMDQRISTGQGFGTLFEIRDGILGRYLGDVTGFQFRTSEFWKNIDAFGGAASAELHSHVASKGEPSQAAAHSVLAVPIRVRNVTVFDSRTFI